MQLFISVLFGTKAMHKPMLPFSQLGRQKHTSVKFGNDIWKFLLLKHEGPMTSKRFPCYWPFVRESTGDRGIHKGPVMRTFVISFDVSLNKQFDKQWNIWSIETPQRSCDVIVTNVDHCPRLNVLSFDYSPNIGIKI